MSVDLWPLPYDDFATFFLILIRVSVILFMFPFFRKLIDGRFSLHYIGRRRNSSPAEGSSSMHKVNQEALIKQSFMIGKELPNLDELGITWVKNV